MQKRVSEVGGEGGVVQERACLAHLILETDLLS